MMIIGGILVGLVMVVFGTSFVRFVIDDFGEHNCLKSYASYLRETLEFPCEILMNKLKKTRIKTPDGVLYCPENRPESFFKEGDEVVFFNIHKRTPYYGEDMGVVTRELPEGPVTGVVRFSHGDDESSTVRVEFVGEKELQIYCDNPLLMHEWELVLIRRNPLLRRLVYCVDLCETINGLNKAIKRAS